MWPNPQEDADLVIFTEEIFNGKLQFLCIVRDLRMMCVGKLYFTIIYVKMYFFGQIYFFDIYFSTLNFIYINSVSCKSVGRIAGDIPNLVRIGISK